jgi:hypothetical protein
MACVLKQGLNPNINISNESTEAEGTHPWVWGSCFINPNIKEED